MGFNPFKGIIDGITNIVNVIGGVVEDFIGWIVSPLVPDIPDFDQGDQQAQGALINKQSNNAHIPVIYGTRKVGGVRVFIEVSGNDNQYLYGAIVLSEGEVNAITKIYVDDDEVTFNTGFSDGGTVTSNDSRFGSTIQMQTFYGTDGQSASSLLTTLSNWTSNHKLSGLCYIAFRFEWDADKYTGIPKIQALVQGKKVVNYTESTTYLPDTTKSLTFNGDAQISNTESKIGGTSLFLDGANDGIVSNSKIDWNLTDWTIEFWFNPSKLTGLQNIFDCRVSGTVVVPIIYLDGTSLRYYTNRSTRISYDISSLMSVGSWSSISVVKNGTTHTLYLDGNSLGTWDSGALVYEEDYVNIGYYAPNLGGDTFGYIDELRISNSARYTSNYTPSNTEFTTDANTLFLTHFDGNNGDTDTDVYSLDSQTTNTYNAQTPAYSSNPAWCLLDYLTNTRYGKGIDIADIDIPSFYTASTIADTQVTPYSGGSDINLFDCNAYLDTSKKLISNVKVLLQGMRGFLPYTQGKYKLIIETTGTASVTLDENNIIGGLKISSEKKNEKYNRVLVDYVSPDHDYQNNTITYPETDAEHQTLKTADDGFLQEGNITLPTITDPYQALEFGEIILERSRNNLTVQCTANYEALDLAIGDIINLDYDLVGFSSKPFRIVGMSINPDFTVALNLIEHQDSWYTFAEKNQVAVLPDTNLPNPFTVQPPASITLGDDLQELNDGTVITRLLITVSPSTDQFVSDYEIEVKQTLDRNGVAVVDDFRIVSQGKSLEYQLLNAVDGGTYEVRARGINSLGVKSTYITGTRKVIGATEPPANVDEFSISLIGSDQMQLSWLPVADLDVESYEIRYQKVSSGYSWFNSTDLVRVPRRSANSIILNKIDPPFTLGIKAIDKLGNESLEPALIVSSNVTNQGYQLIDSISEHPNFAGTFTNTFKRTETGTVLGDNVITLDTISKFDDGIGLIDAVDSNYVFETGGIDKNIISSGFYDFSSTFTLPFVFDATFKIQLDMVSDDPYDLFDFGRGEDLFENAKAPFDGNLPTNAGTNIQIGASETSLDDISTFTSVAQQGTFKGKYFKFRARLISLNNQSRALVKGLTVSLNLQKRSETGDDITSGAGTYFVNFTNPFYASPNVNVTGQDMATGDYFVVTNKSTDGFEITFYNSSDVAISRTFDYQANSYGLKSP